MQLFKQKHTISISRWVLFPLRLFLGITFLYAGFQKLTDPQFFEPTAVGYIGKQILAFSQASPLHDLLLKVVEPHVLLFGLLIAYGEIAIGLGTLFGFLARPAAIFGFLMSTLFFLSATWRVYPYFYGSDIVFMCCWLTLLINGLANTGLPSLDESLANYFIQRAPTAKSKQRRKKLLRVFLGMPLPQPATTANRWEPTTGQQPVFARSGSQFVQQHTGPAPSLLIRPPFSTLRTTAGGPSQPLPAVYAQPNGQPRFTQPLIEPQIQTQAPPDSIKQMLQKDRRTFMTGVFAGVAATLLTAATAYSMIIFSTKKPTAIKPKTTGTTTPKTAQATKKTPTPKPATNQPPIAQANAVHLNSSVTFTIPSPDDPAGPGTTGILVHLNDDRFVAFDATCTHAGCQVDYDTQTTTLICPCHGAQFDPANNAQPVHPPATVPLKSVAIHVDSATGDITLAKQ